MLSSRTNRQANILRLRPDWVSAADNVDSRQRISSRRTQWVVLLGALAALILFSVTLRTLFLPEQMPWLQLALGIVSAFVSMSAFLAWKRVWRGEQHYIVSNLFKSETISFGDVCLVVEAHGLIWNTVRVHFNRPTRFGWDITFVPARSAGTACTLAAAWRTRRLVK
jgi:hypothetical protein